MADAVRIKVARSLGLLKHKWGATYDELGGAVCEHGCEQGYPGKLRCPKAPVPTLKQLRRKVVLEIKLAARQLGSMQRLRRDIDGALANEEPPPKRKRNCRVCTAFDAHLEECELCASDVEGPEGWCAPGLKLYNTPCLETCARRTGVAS